MDSRYWVVIAIAAGVILTAAGLLLAAWSGRRRGPLFSWGSRGKNRPPSEPSQGQAGAAYESEGSQGPDDHRLRALQRSGRLPVTGIVEVDRLIYQKDCLCAEKEIDRTWRMGEIPEGLLPPKALVSLLGNLLDNAIEAAEKSGGWIRAESAVRRGHWVLRIGNSKSPDESPLENGLATTKEDREHHGLGSGIVDDIIRASDGYVKRRDEGDRFKVFAAVPVRRESR